MLVVINGAASVNLSLFARNIVQTLNGLDQYQLDGYVVDYTTIPIVARDTQGNIVYKEGDPETEGVTTLRPEVDEEAAIIARIKEFNSVIVWANRFGALNDRYSDFRYDYGITPTPMFEEDYQQVVDGYHARELAHVAIYGTFSKAFVDKLRADLSETEVVVLNITRNPSVQYLLYGFMRDVTKEDPRIPNTTDLLITSIVNNYTFRNVPYANTVRYEDLLAGRYLDVAEHTVRVPDELVLYNAYITTHDRELLDVEKQGVEEFNVEINNPGIALETPQLPGNIFEGLLYHPLTYEDVVAHIE